MRQVPSFNSGFGTNFSVPLITTLRYRRYVVNCHLDADKIRAFRMGTN